jgi:hypothetical protein
LLGDDYPRNSCWVLQLASEASYGETSDDQRLSINYEPNHKERKHHERTNEREEMGGEGEFYLLLRVGDDFPRIGSFALQLASEVGRGETSESKRLPINYEPTSKGTERGFVRCLLCSIGDDYPRLEESCLTVDCQRWTMERPQTHNGCRTLL